MEEMPFNDLSEIRTPAFHGQSSSGNVTAQFVYAHFGREQDYDDLDQNHAEVKGKIAIVKYGMVYRGAKMSTAAERSLVGILIYTDPQQDGNITEGHGYKGYPDGPARPETCIERGSIGSIRESYARVHYAYQVMIMTCCDQATPVPVIPVYQDSPFPHFLSPIAT